MELRLYYCVLLVAMMCQGTEQSGRHRRQENSASAGGSCLTPRNVTGVCINIRECPLHLDYLTNKRGEPGILQYLQAALCLKQGSQVFTCCPRESSGGTCETPQKAAGKCIDIKSCPSLLNLLERYREPGVSQYLRQSQCGLQAGQPLVCCPVEGPGQLPGKDVCGVVKANIIKIVNGKPASLGAWPWMVALGYKTRNVALAWRCGGSLITDRFVLTAAHCIATGNQLQLIMARVGDLDLNDTVQDGATPMDIPVERSFTHESYNARANIFDIGLVKLSKQVRFTDLILPICLPTKSLFEDDLTGFSPFIAGWGATSHNGPSKSHLQEAQLDVTTLAECANAYKNLTNTVIVDSRNICAQSPLGKDSCQGDSGGPLMLPKYSGSNPNFYQIGVVSFGYKCAEPGYPGVYTRVDLHLDWISKNIQ